MKGSSTFSLFYPLVSIHGFIYSRSFNNFLIVVLYTRAYAVWEGSKRIFHLLAVTTAVRLLSCTFLRRVCNSRASFLQILIVGGILLRIFIL